LILQELLELGRKACEELNDRNQRTSNVPHNKKEMKDHQYPDSFSKPFELSNQPCQGCPFLKSSG
jgi:hypothetical protein